MVAYQRGNLVDFHALKIADVPENAGRAQDEDTVLEVVGSFSMPLADFIVQARTLIDAVTPGQDPGRNAPCHCDSGKKFKHCHGA